MILVDTSVWIDHFHRGNERLKNLLNENQVLCHPFVIGELACGNMKNRKEILGLVNSLQAVQTAGNSEVLHLLDLHHFYGIGLGWIDAHLLASALLTGCGLWTLDKPLRSAAEKIKLSV